MIRKQTLLGLLVLVSLKTTAQGRYCTSYDDYIAGNWIELPSLTVSPESTSEKVPDDALDYSFTTNDKSTDKKLKKEAFIIECNDSLFISLRNLRCNNGPFTDHFAHAYPLPDNKLLFTTRRSQKRGSTLYASVGVMGGAIGGAIAGAALNTKSSKKHPVCYVTENIDLGNHIPVRLLDDDLIPKVMKGHQDMIDEYYLEEKKSKRERAEHIMPLLKKAGIIE